MWTNGGIAEGIPPPRLGAPRHPGARVRLTKRARHARGHEGPERARCDGTARGRGAARSPDRRDDRTAGRSRYRASAEGGDGLDAATTPTPEASPEADAPPEFRCTACPASQPAIGDPCTSDGLICEYGSDPRPLWNVVLICNGTRWANDVFNNGVIVPLADSGRPVDDGGCPPTYDIALSAPCGRTSPCVYPGAGTCNCEVDLADGPDAAAFWACVGVAAPTRCPSSLAQAEVDGQACTVAGLDCFYPGGECHCYQEDAGSPWSCTVPDPGCPAIRPRLGSACVLGVTGRCTYGPLGCSGPLPNELLWCVPAVPGDAGCGGVWAHGPGGYC